MVLCPLHHAALQTSLWDHSEGTPVALSPQCVPKDTCHLATSPSHIWLPAETHPEGPHPVYIPPGAHPAPGDTHLPPVLEPRDLGGWEAIGVTLQRQGLPGHARHVGPVPVLPEAGGHLGEGEAEEPPLGRSATARDPTWAVLPGLEGSPDSPLFPSFWASSMPIPDSGRQEPCGPGNGHGGLALGPRPGRAQELYWL